MDDTREHYLEFTVRGLAVDPATKAPILVLQDPNARLLLPIWIGSSEAAAIVAALDGRPLPRPMTHDLMANLVKVLGGELLSVDICALRDTTFYACIRIRHPDGSEHRIDCRPSDGVALAVRFDTSIRVEAEVLEAAQPVPEDEQDKIARAVAFVSGDDEEGRVRLAAELEAMDPDDLGDFEN
jgi:bifunctional DNase/RNase